MDLEDRRRAEFAKYERVYAQYPHYGNREPRIGLTMEWLDQWPREWSMLDVGAGRGEVVDAALDSRREAIGAEVVPDLHPRNCIIPGAHSLPWHDRQFALVTCTDVMEHLLEEDVPAALSELSRVARRAVLMVICHRPDTPGKYGPDTLHITVHDRAWWLERISENMEGTARVLYEDRVNQNGTWIEVVK